MLTPMLKNNYQLHKSQSLMLTDMQYNQMKINIFIGEIEIAAIYIKLLVLTILLTVNIYVNTWRNQSLTTAIQSAAPSLPDESILL